MEKIDKLLAGIMVIVTKDSSRYAELKIQEVEAFTERAVLIKIDNKNIWFPHKCLGKSEDKKIYCQKWLAEKNGLVAGDPKQYAKNMLDKNIFDVLKQLDGRATCPACFDVGINNALNLVDGVLQCEGVECDFAIEFKVFKAKKGAA